MNEKLRRSIDIFEDKYGFRSNTEIMVPTVNMYSDAWRTLKKHIQDKDVVDAQQGSIIKACEDGAVIEAVYQTKIYATPWYTDAVSEVSSPPRVMGYEYVLQTFFGNDIIIEINSHDIIVDFCLCNIRNVDWEDDEEELRLKYDKINRDIARLYANQTPVKVITDDNWRRE